MLRVTFPMQHSDSSMLLFFPDRICSVAGKRVLRGPKAPLLPISRLDANYRLDSYFTETEEEPMISCIRGVDKFEARVWFMGWASVVEPKRVCASIYWAIALRRRRGREKGGLRRESITACHTTAIPGNLICPFAGKRAGVLAMSPTQTL